MQGTARKSASMSTKKSVAAEKGTIANKLKMPENIDLDIDWKERYAIAASVSSKARMGIGQ